MLHLVFDLHGTMAGFGDHSIGGQRRAATHVPRSAVYGLLHACMGIDRRDVHADHPAIDGLHLAIAQAVGGTMVDYHTAATQPKGKNVLWIDGRPYKWKPKENSWRPISGILSERGYQTDLAATVAVWGDEGVLRQAHAALLRPAWTPYLGRRSCPLTAPLKPELVEAASLAGALQDRTMTDVRIHGDKHPKPGFSEAREGQLVPDRPEGTRGDRRFFARSIRYEYGGSA